MTTAGRRPRSDRTCRGGDCRPGPCRRPTAGGGPARAEPGRS
ncbi:hypothetical protein FRUB_03721 [Fimbriiglobus ruber]|uniref:Uncharacterized protein n=1 Tax=Fimbriiglobus ruber TaxID=1908690 RepID=A0A225DL08_9BACT|nr:hypothetical protein FRUB_03721 [Fimbriiglobus ruber]